MTLITVVTPTFNEEANIEECHREVQRVFKELLPGCNYRHLFADNASTDATPEILKRIAAADPNVQVLFNARNVGPFRSTFNALRFAEGDAIVVQLAADLQDPPEVIAQFVEKWKSGFDVVYGVRSKREESKLLELTRRVYYRMVRRFAEIDIPVDAGEFQLIDRHVADELVRVDDYYPYIRGMIAECGFRSTGVAYTWRARRRGMSSNSLYRLIDQGLNGIVSFSNIPIRAATLAGFGISMASLTYSLVQLLINIIFFREFAAPGIASLIVGLFFFSGVQLFFVGVIGEYINAIHSQVRHKGRVVLRDTLNVRETARPLDAKTDASAERRHPA